MTVQVGASLGNRYEILDVVGQGGMSTVYKAKDAVLGRHVAVKVLHRQYSQDHEFLTRFKREARSAASLIHPNIVTVYDTGEDDGTHYIILEYIEGEQLKELIRERGPLPMEMALDIAKQAGQALSYAHRREIIHRDIKPHNLMLSKDGRVLVTDFGIAKARSQPGITQDGTVLGTVQYIAPEQARGEISDAQSDIYALGICFYEMITGLQPFRGDNPVEVALKHVRDELPPMTRHGEPVDPRVEQIVKHATAKEKAERYLTADQFVEALSAMLAAPDVVPGSEDSERTRVLKAVRKPKKAPKSKPTPQPAVAAAPGAPEQTGPQGNPLVAWSVLAVLVIIVGLLGYAAVKVVPPLVRQAQSSAKPTPVAPKLVRLPVSSVKDFDPQGSDGSESPDLTGDAIDVDLETAWHTDTYNTESFGNLKDGVGIYFDLGSQVQVDRVRVVSLESGWDVSIKGSNDAPDDVAKWTELASRSGVADKFNVGLTGAKYRYVLLWITSLAPNPSGDRYRVDIPEVLFYGKKL